MQDGFRIQGRVQGLGFRGDAAFNIFTQRAQYPSMQEYTLHGTRVPKMIEAIFLT